MMRTKRLQHRFVATMPEMFESGILYVSMEYATAAHRCCCGCGEEVYEASRGTNEIARLHGKLIIDLMLDSKMGRLIFGMREPYVPSDQPDDAFRCLRDRRG